MNCEEVNSHLIDYLDKTLDTATKTRVATHLISCPTCGSEASELADCMHQVAALPAIDPPIGFAQRVMAHVHELEAKPSLWQRMFLPWSRKLPLQAAALLMVGIMGVLLYQKDEQLKPTERHTMTPTAMLDSVQPTDESASTDKREAINKKETASPTPVAIAKAAEPAKQDQPSVAPARQRGQIGKREAEVRVAEAKASTRKPIQVQEASTMRERPGFAGESAFVPPIPLGGLRPPPPRSGTLALDRFVPLGQRLADYEFVVRRRPPPARRERAEDVRVEHRADVLQADSVTAPSTPAQINPRIESIAEIRFYSVAPEHYEYFKKELASEAIIEAEPEIDNKESVTLDRQLLIKVTILPAILPEPSGALR